VWSGGHKTCGFLGQLLRGGHIAKLQDFAPVIYLNSGSVMVV
jgi:hypothetical protein